MPIAQSMRGANEGVRHLGLQSFGSKHRMV